MNIAELKEDFFSLVPSHPPNDWEIEEHLENIAELPTELQELVLAHVPAIWSVSHSLCYSYLSSAGSALDCLPTDRLTPWVRDFLDIYEKDGLRAAQHFMADVESNFLCRIRGEAGLDFAEAAGRLTPYARSIIERRVTLAPGPRIYTDTEFIYLPSKLTLCSSDEDNFLLYKLIVTFQLGFLLLGTYEFDLPADHALIQGLVDTYGAGPVPDRIEIEQFPHLFPDPHLAEDIFSAAEGQRVSHYLAAEFPGLWRDTARIRSNLAAARTVHHDFPIPAKVLEMLTHNIITGRTGAEAGSSPQSLNSRILAEFSDDVGLFAVVYDEFSGVMEREARGAEVAEERVTQVTRGQEQLLVARRRVAQVLNDFRVAQPDMPPAVVNILREGWHDVMLLANLREGEESTAWKHA